MKTALQKKNCNCKSCEYGNRVNEQEKRSSSKNSANSHLSAIVVLLLANKRRQFVYVFFSVPVEISEIKVHVYF